MIQFESIKHPNKKEKKGTIRAQTIISGYLIKKFENYTEVNIISQVDVKVIFPRKSYKLIFLLKKIGGNSKIYSKSSCF